MIQVQNTRFGSIDIDETAAIEFPQGIIGFSEETRFVLVERAAGKIAYLQSLRTPCLALPVLDATALEPSYAGDAAADLANVAGIDAANMAIIVVVYVNEEDRSLRANLLAPIVVDASARKAWQIILDPEKYAPNARIGSVANDCNANHTNPI
jgi:flagellar assembly factor FliW